MTNLIYMSLTSVLGKTVLDDGQRARAMLKKAYKEKAYIDLDLSVKPSDLGLRGFPGLSVSNLERPWADQEEVSLFWSSKNLQSIWKEKCM